MDRLIAAARDGAHRLLPFGDEVDAVDIGVAELEEARPEAVGALPPAIHQVVAGEEAVQEGVGAALGQGQGAADLGKREPIRVGREGLEDIEAARQ